MSLKFRKCIFLLTLIVSLGLICQIAVGNRLDTINLQLKWKHQFQFAGNYAAKELGYYSDQGLYVNIIEAKDNTDVISSVIDGKADVGIATSDIIIARNNGVPLVVIANIFQHSPYVFITLSNDEGDNIHDLSGKSIMLENHAEELLAYLKTEQIDIDEITFLPHSYAPDELIAGDVFAISAYLTDEPFRLLEQNIDYNTYNPRSSGIDFYGDLLFTTEKTILEKPDVIQRFIAATAEGWEYALNNQEELISLIYNKYSTRHSIEHLRFEAQKTERLIMPDVVEIGYINPKRWKRIGEIYSELGMLPSNFNTTGFLYTSEETPNLTRFYLIIVSILALSAIITIIALRFYRLNKKLKTESVQRQVLMDEVSSANRYRGRLLSIISHDLKGPIGTLNSFLEILISDEYKLSPEKQNDVLVKFKDALANTYEMMNMLLLWALNQKDNQSLIIQKNSVFKIIEKNLELLSTKADRKGIIFEISCNQEDSFYFDSNMISIVVRNLIDNAVKYSYENSVIRIKVDINDEELHFSIEDSGMGIENQYLTILFDFENSTLSSPGTKGEKGTGLGLVLCKEFIDKHNGKIWAESQVGQGSTFFFSIPGNQ